MVSIVITTVLSIDDDNVVYRRVVKRQMRKAGAVESDVPGVLFLEVDGLGHDVLAHWAGLEEVAAFEELIGSHGGMGGPQQYPFVLVPDGFRRPDHLLLGPGTVHDWMRRWLADLGHEAYRDERAASAV